MSFILGSQFIIGDFKFKGCNDLKITKSIHELADRAVIKLPTSAVIKCEDPQTESVQTAKTLKVGDKVSIKLSYNGDLKDEFVGFVSVVNAVTPAEIECEGYSWQLRRKKNIKKSWASTTLLEVLKFVTKGTDIKLHPAIPSMPLKNIVVNNGNGLEVIEYIRDLLKGALTAFFQGDVLYVGLTYFDVAKTTVKYRLGWNTISNNNLKFKKAIDTVVNIQLQFRQDSGKMVSVTVGQTGGITKTEVISTATSAKQLNDIAKARLLQESYDGYEGNISTFLIPYCQPGYRAEITDKRYPERNGNYFCDSVETSYGQGGARRTVGISIKLSS